MQEIKPDISPELSQRIQALAAESHCSADEIIERALSHGLDNWEKEFRLIQSAAHETDRGEFASDAAIESVRNKYRPKS